MLGSFPVAARQAPNVAVSQFGQARTGAIQAGNYFTLQGTGFKTWSPAKVCFTGIPCVKSDVDSDGTFTQLDRLDYPGTYTVHVYQLKTRNGGDSTLMYSGTLSVE
ncbi:MAG TPA: hypothetical protein VNL37_05410 [Candidatus Polarisedimenticolia bacterium]|nr:hypothetical protein [Candidatus Polarisedimenticolia bacterium]